jgi:serine/threonine protein kinase
VCSEIRITESLETIQKRFDLRSSLQNQVILLYSPILEDSISPLSDANRRSFRFLASWTLRTNRELELRIPRALCPRDLKPENILIALDESIKVCDFGLAINVRLERPASRLGTLQYMAPEVVKRPFQRPRDMSKVDTYDEGVDIW